MYPTPYTSSPALTPCSSSYVCVCVCVCVCMCRYFLEWETIPFIYINICAHAHTHTLTHTHAVYVCTWRVGGYDGLRLYLPWFHPITQGQPRPALLPSAHPLTYTILVCACPHVCVCVCVCVAYEHVYFYSVCVCVCVYEDGGKEERIFSSALTHTHTQKKKMRYRFQSQRASKSVNTGILVFKHKLSKYHYKVTGCLSVCLSVCLYRRIPLTA